MPAHRASNALDADLVDVFTYDLQVSGGAVSPQTPFRGVLYLWKEYTHA